MKYIIEDADCNVIKEFETERERKTWTACNCYLELVADNTMAYCFMGRQIFYYEEA